MVFVPFIWVRHLDFNMGKRMVDDAANKKRYLWISMIGNVGMLGYFKYCNFFIDISLMPFSAQWDLGASLQNLDIFLPVGISFTHFKRCLIPLTFTKGELKPRNNFIDYLAFISFFPQLVAGPVERAATLLPQMEMDKVFKWSQFRSGNAVGTLGCLSRRFGSPMSLPCMWIEFFLLENPSSAMIWAATLGSLFR